MDYPFPIDEEKWGELIYMERYTPDIWYFVASVDPDISRPSTDGFYAVTKGSSKNIFSEEALRYGEEIEGVLYFDQDHGRDIIGYELMRAGKQISFTRKKGRAPSLDRALKDAAAFGSEDFPEYFGPLPVPQLSPLGPITRRRPIQDGVCLVEANSKWLLALSYPIWDELGDDTLRLALWNEGTMEQADIVGGAAFFTSEQCGPAIYDLLYYKTKYLLLRECIEWDALVATLWEHHPSYMTRRTNEPDKACEHE